MNLEGTGVCDEGLKQLQALTELYSLGLAGTKVTHDGVSELSQALPNCQIQWETGTWVGRSATVADRALPTKSTKRKEEPPDDAVASLTEKVLGWLPTDTETIRVAQGPFKIVETQKLSESQEIDVVLQASNYGLLTYLKQGAYSDLLAGQGLSLALEGARNFQTSEANGSEACQVLVFDKPLGAIGDQLMDRFRADALGCEQLVNQEVLRFEEATEFGTASFMVSRPSPQILLVSSHKGYLRTVLERLSNTAPREKWWQTLPEWTHISPQAPYWWMRHFSRENAQADKSSPFVFGELSSDDALWLHVDPGQGTGGWEAPDAKAIGLAFSYFPTDGNTLKFRYLTESSVAETIASHAWMLPPPEIRWPMVERLSADTVEITFRAEHPDIAANVLMWAIGRFGHAIGFI